MAKARPKNPARERVVSAFKKAHPAYTRDIEVFKRRSAQTIVVYGRDNLGCQICGVWSYANNGSLERVN